MAAHRHPLVHALGVVNICPLQTFNLNNKQVAQLGLRIEVEAPHADFARREVLLLERVLSLCFACDVGPVSANLLGVALQVASAVTAIACAALACITALTLLTANAKKPWRLDTVSQPPIDALTCTLLPLCGIHREWRLLQSQFQFKSEQAARQNNRSRKHFIFSYKTVFSH